MIFDCKGYANRGAVTVRYRGVTATVRGGRLVWCMGVKPAGKRFKRLDIRSARTTFEFRRKVDFVSICGKEAADAGN